MPIGNRVSEVASDGETRWPRSLSWNCQLPRGRGTPRTAWAQGFRLETELGLAWCRLSTVKISSRSENRADVEGLEDKGQSVKWLLSPTGRSKTNAINYFPVGLQMLLAGLPNRRLR